MAAILTALGSGLSARKILEFLMRKSPELAPRINKILAAGLSAEKVLSFFTKGQNFDKLRASMEKEYPMENNANPLVQAENVRSRNLAPDMASGLQRAAPGLALGAGAIGTAMALRHALPNQLETPIEQKTLENKTAPSQIPPQQNIPQSIPQGQQLQQPQVKNIAKDSDILWNALQQGKKGVDQPTNAFLKIAKQMQTTGEIGSKEDFDKLYDLFQQKQAQGASLPKALKEASNEFSKAKLQPEAAPEAPVEEAKPIAKSQMVATPHGVGEVITSRNGKAIVDVGGRKHQVNEDDLIQSPIPEKDLADLYDDLIAGIEKKSGQQVSRNVEWAGYDEKNNELAYRPHGAKFYVYDDISPEDAKMLTSLLTQRKSTGENFIGAWEAGTESPIGAAMYQLIQKLQKERGGKGNEYKNRFDTIYDAIGLAREAAKKRHAERKKKAKKSGLT